MSPLQPFVVPSLSRRILSRLIEAEHHELDPWLRDDLRIARLTVIYAATGEALLCSPHVLASYAVLGLHPEKVWPAILARRQALGGSMLDVGAPPIPRKPAQAVKLWTEKTNGARAVNSRAGEALVLRGPRLLPMATASIAALYPNSDAASSAKTRQFTFDEVLQIVRYSGAPHPIRSLTASAIEARGPWPERNGPVSAFLCVSWIGMMVEGGCSRRTAQRRAKRACQLGFWRKMREANRWTNCPKCNTPRDVGRCSNCKYKGDAKDLNEFCRTNGYEFDIDKFLTARRCREIHSVDWRSYQEYKAAAKRGEHPNLAEWPRKTPQPAPPEPPPATAAPIPVKQPAAEHAHRNPTHSQPSQPKLTKRECAKLVADVAELMRGRAGHNQLDGYHVAYDPGDPRFRPKLTFREALEEAARIWKRQPEVVVEAFKFWGYKIDPDPTP